MVFSIGRIGREKLASNNESNNKRKEYRNELLGK